MQKRSGGQVSNRRRSPLTSFEKYTDASWSDCLRWSMKLWVAIKRLGPDNPQSRTKLLEKVFPIMSTFLRNKTISKTTPLRKENPFPQFNVASYKTPGIRLNFEYTTTLLSGDGGEGRTGKATMFRKMLSRYTIFSTVLSKIAALRLHYYLLL